MHDLATEWYDHACAKADDYKTDGVRWKVAGYFFLIATGTAGASGGTALGGYPYWAAGLAFVAAAATVVANIASSEVGRQRTKKVAWRQFQHQAEVFLRVTLPNEPGATVDAAFQELEASINKAEASDIGS